MQYPSDMVDVNMYPFIRAILVDYTIKFEVKYFIQLLFNFHMEKSRNTIQSFNCVLGKLLVNFLTILQLCIFGFAKDTDLYLYMSKEITDIKGIIV